MPLGGGEEIPIGNIVLANRSFISVHRSAGENGGGGGLQKPSLFFARKPGSISLLLTLGSGNHGFYFIRI